MDIYSWAEFIEDPPHISQQSTISVGVFDGVHAGHKLLISCMERFPHTQKWIFTFSENPRRILRSGHFPGDLMTRFQKIEELKRLGITNIVLIDFSNDFSKLTGKDFFTAIIKRIPVHAVVLGDNFRCGRGGSASAYDVRDFLTSRNIEVMIPQPLAWRNRTISSTRIRAAIQEGDFASVRMMTERAFTLDVADLPQRTGVKAITIDKKDVQQVLPPPGSYQVYISKNGEQAVLTTLSIDEAFVRWIRPNCYKGPVHNIQFVTNEE